MKHLSTLPAAAHRGSVLSATVLRRQGLPLVMAALLSLGGCSLTPNLDTDTEQPGVPSAYRDWFDGGWPVAMDRLDWGRVKRVKEAIAVEDYAKATSSLQAMMKLDYPPAYYEMAKLYHYGRGVEQNALKAEELYGKAMEAPSPILGNASLNLAKLYLDPAIPQLAAGDDRDVLAYHLLRQAIDEGVTGSATVLLAQLLATGGERVKANPRLAKQLYQQAADQDQPEAFWALALAHRPGGWLKEDSIQAKELLRRYENTLTRRAKQGDVSAMQQLAKHYDEEGLFGHQPDKQLMWLSTAAESNDRSAQRQAGRAFLETNTPELGIALLEKSAKHGDVDAMAVLGKALLERSTAPADISRATRLLKRAIDQGSVDASISLGRAYLAGKSPDGKGVEASPQQGLELLESVAGQAEGLALALLGKAYRENPSVPAQPALARDYLERGHQLGHPYATAQLGELYLTGQGINRDPQRGEALLQSAADQGQVQAIRRLGEAYIAGDTLPKRPEQGVALLERAIALGDITSMTRLGNAYLQGDHLPQRPQQAKRLLEKASEAGDTTAMVWLGEAYLQGEVLAYQPEQGIALLKRASDAGDLSAMTRLGNAYLQGTPEPQPLEGRRLLEEAANQGDAYAMAVLGRAYRQGRGVPRDLEKSAQWLRRAQQAGHSSAERSLLLTQRDQGRHGDIKALEQAAQGGLASAQADFGDWLWQQGRPEPALAWFKRAARQGHTGAQLDLAHAYLDGKRIAQDKQQGLDYLEQAVRAGDASAYQLKGKVYLEGIGVEANGAKAETWLRRAADAGETSAKALLGRALLRGEEGIPQDTDQGIALLEAAAQQGNTGAQATLGRAYLRGEQIPRNPRKGADYLFRAAEKGHSTARLALAEAYLRAKGLEHANQRQALLWLDKVMASDSEAALATLHQLLVKGEVASGETTSADPS